MFLCFYMPLSDWTYLCSINRINVIIMNIIIIIIIDIVVILVKFKMDLMSP